MHHAVVDEGRGSYRSWWPSLLGIGIVQIFLISDFFWLRWLPPWPEEIVVLVCALPIPPLAAWARVVVLFPPVNSPKRGSVFARVVNAVYLATVYLLQGPWLIRLGGFILIVAIYGILSAQFVVPLDDRFNREVISWDYTEGVKKLKKEREDYRFATDKELIEKAGREVEEVYEKNSLDVARVGLLVYWFLMVAIASTLPPAFPLPVWPRRFRTKWNIGDYRSIASCVDRDATEVDPILAAAAGALGRGIGEALADPLRYRTRIREVAAALYHAILFATRLQYEYEPANPGEHTIQEIRLGREVLRTGFGTCLDLALMYASVLEKAHVAPCVVFWKRSDTGASHAVAGFFDEIELPSDRLVVTEPESIRKMVREGSLVLVETTGLSTAEGQRLDFAQACARGQCLLESAAPIAVVNVLAAREAGVEPPK